MANQNVLQLPVAPNLSSATLYGAQGGIDVGVPGSLVASASNLSVLQGGTFGSTLAQSGDNTGLIDQAALNTAIALVGTSGATPPGFTYPLSNGAIFLSQGTYYLTQSMLLSITGSKLSGFIFQGSGSNVTKLVYTPAVVGQPMFINRTYLTARFKGMSIICVDATNQTDFCWEQENSGSTIQDVIDDDVMFSGFRRIRRRTGTNNNSEYRAMNCFATICGNWLYTPPAAVLSLTPGTTLSPTNLNADIQNGDQGLFTVAVAPLLTTNNYYAVNCVQGALGTTSFQVSATLGGSPITVTGTGSTTFRNASDQFLNFHFGGITKFWSATDSMINMNFGGGFTFEHLDASAWKPTSPCTFVGSCSGATLTIASITTGTLNTGMNLECATGGTQIAPGTVLGALLTGTGGAGSTWAVNISQTIASSTNLMVVVPLFRILGGAHSGGVMGFHLKKMRIELANDVSRCGYFEWLSGNVEIVTDESSQASFRNASNLNWVFNLTNNTGPTISVHDASVAGQMGFVCSTNNFNFIPSVEVHNSLLLQALNPGAFVVENAVSNSGGTIWIDFDKITQPVASVLTTAGNYKQILDCTLNYSKAAGAISKIRTANMIGPSGNLPNSNGSWSFQFPQNATLVEVNWFVPSLSGNGAWTLQTNEATPTVLGTISTTAGTASSGKIPLTFFMNSDLARKLSIVDTLNRALANGCQFSVSYIGG